MKIQTNKLKISHLLTIKYQIVEIQHIVKNSADNAIERIKERENKKEVNCILRTFNIRIRFSEST